MSRRSSQKILVLHAGALGDFVLALHLVDAMRTAWATPSIMLAARSPLARWAQRHGLASEACSLDGLGIHRLYDRNGEWPEDLSCFLRRFDRIVSFLGGPDEALSVRLSSLSGAGVLAIDPKPSEVMLRDGIHITQQWARRLAAYGWPVSVAGHAAIRVSPSEQLVYTKQLAERLGDSSRRIVLCHPGSGGLDKCCPLEVLERVIRALIHEGWSAGWMIGPDEIERFGDAYGKRLEASAPVILEESIEAAADLVCGARVYIGNDAGMTHVAALVGLQTFVIFGPTDPRVWRPLGDKCRVVRFPPEARSTGTTAWIDELLSRIDRL